MGKKRPLAGAVLGIILGMLSISPALGGTLYQVSTIDALMEGIYDGTVSTEELLRHGTAGLGTFHGLDGEMIVFGGICYQAPVSGDVHPVSPEETTPFAAVASWAPEEEEHFSLENMPSLEALKKALLARITNPNIPWLILGEGCFGGISWRSVPPQQKPYPPLGEAAKHQRIFSAQALKGKLVGFWSPSWVKGINVPGFHLHVLSENTLQGGHLLGCAAPELKCTLVPLYEYALTLPRSEAFRKADLEKDQAEALHKVEQAPGK